MKKIAQILTIVLLTTGMYSCFYFPVMITGTGPIVKQEFSLESFNAIADETVIDVEIVKGDSQKVVAEGNENMINFLQLKVVNNKLHVDLVPGCYGLFELKLYVTVPTLKEIDLQSTGNISTEAFSELPSLKMKSSSTGTITTEGTFVVNGDVLLESTSTGNINLNVNCENIDVNMTSTGSISIEGRCESQEVSISGTGNYDAFDFLSEECTIETSSTGNARVNVSDQLNATISSVGSIYYKGNPRISVHDSSIGKLIHSN
jgi:hypothetical protein